MILAVHAIPEADRLAAIHDRIALLQWRDGRETAGSVAREVKRNEQAAMDSTAGRSLTDEISTLLWDNQVIRAAAQPRRLSHLLISRTGEGGGYGAHVDNALMGRGERRVRTDLSFTLFLTPPEDYDGGELVIHAAGITQSVKGAAGHLVLYPSGSIHEVRPVTRVDREHGGRCGMPRDAVRSGESARHAAGAVAVAIGRAADARQDDRQPIADVGAALKA